MTFLPVLLLVVLAGCSSNDKPSVTNNDGTGETTSEGMSTSNPDTSNPGTSNPDTSNPGTSDPGTSDPDTSDPDTSDPDTSDPDTSDPDTSNPDTSNPGTSNPDTSDPGTNNGETQALLSGFDFLPKSQDIINSIAGYQLEQLAIVVDDLAFTVEQTTTIVWPNDDYYQVQNPLTFASVCDGGTQCNVVPGNYLVTNQTSDTREFIVVPYIDPADLSNATQLPDTTFIIEDAVGGPETMPIVRTSYACENGGTMIKETGAEQPVTLNSFDYQLRPGRIALDGYQFDQCRITISDGLLTNDTYLLQGNFQHLYSSSYGTGNSDLNSFDAFSITGDNGLVYQVQGQALFNVWNEGFVFKRDVTITEYQKTLPGGQIAERLNDVQYNFDSAFSSAPYIYDETLDVDGNYRSTEIGNQLVAVKTEPTMVRRRTQFDTNFTEGQIEMLAEDGSYAYVRGNAYIDPNISFVQTRPLIDLDYTNATGEQFQSTRVTRSLLTKPLLCEEGRIVRVETGRYECITDGNVTPTSHLNMGYNRPIIVP